MFAQRFLPCFPSLPAGRPAASRCRRMLRAALLGSFAWAIGLAATAEESAVAQLEVRRDGEVYTVRASAQLAAEQRVVWETLTDYERLREFVPGVTRTRVLTRNGNQLSIEQSGVFSVLFLDRPVQLRLAVVHIPQTTVLARLLPAAPDTGEATLRNFSGRYTLSPSRSPQRPGVRLDYDAEFELAAPLPALVATLFGVSAVRQTMREQFVALLREIERRQAALARAGNAG